MIELTDFQYKVLTAMADLDIDVSVERERFPEKELLAADLIEEIDLATYRLTEQGRAMFKDAGLRRIQ